MVRTFDQIKKDVLAMPLNEEEICRIVTEISLFIDRGWQDYIALAVNILNEVEEKVKFCFTGLSLLDSLFVLKATNRYVPDNFVKKDRPFNILFNDALRLSIEVVYASREELIYLSRLTHFIVTELATLNRFHTRQKVAFKPGHEYRDCLIAVSKKRVPEEDFRIIVNETSDGPREEINTLHKYFLVYLSCHQGI